ncbi:hypothetical protein ES703_112087 [subsurface metagenome]
MSYNYETQKPKVLTPEGQKMLFEIRARAASLIEQSGAVMLDKAVSGIGVDSWDQLACVDYLVELGELREIPQSEVMAQHRIFVAR